MITREDVEGAGFKPYKWDQPYCVAFYQKAIRDSANTLSLFFIEIKFWIFPGMPERASAHTRLYKGPIGHEWDVQMELLVREGMTVQGIEEFFRLAYDRLGCRADRDNN